MKKSQKIQHPEKIAEVIPWIPIKIFYLLITGWIIFILLNYYGSQQFAVRISLLNPIFDGLLGVTIFHEHFFKICLSVVLCCWIAWVSCGTGLFVLGCLNMQKIGETTVWFPTLAGRGDSHGGQAGLDFGRGDRVETLIFGFGTGLAVLSILTFVLGLCGMLYPRAAYVMLILLTIPAFLSWRKFKILQTFKDFSFPKHGRLIIGILLLVNFAGVLVPEIFYDSMYYHLAVPNYYIIHHRILPMPTNFYSAFPMNMEMLYTLALLLSDEILAKMMHFLACSGLALALMSFARKYLSSRTGLWANVFFIGMPVVILNTWSTGVEIGQTFFGFLSFFALLNAFRSEQKESGKWLIISGALAGFTMGIKYTGFTILPVSLVLMAWQRIIRQKHQVKKALVEMLVFSAVAVLVVSPWLFKNIAYHKNPVYPFMGTRFGEPRITADRWRFLQSDAFARDWKGVFKNTDNIKRILLHPWILTKEGQSNANFPGPGILAFLPLLVLVRLRSSALRLLRFYFVLQWSAWLVTTEMPRFFLPGIVYAGLLFGGIIEEIFKPGLIKKILVFLCGIITFGNIYWSVLILQSQGGWLVLFGKLSREAYLSRMWSTYPYPSFIAYDYMNKTLDHNSKILVMGDARSHYLKRQHVSFSVHDSNPLISWALESKDEKELFEKFAGEKITHIFLNYFEAERLNKSYRIFQWNEYSLDIFEKFWDRHVELIWNSADLNDRKNQHALFLYAVKEKTSKTTDNLFRSLK